MSSNHKPRKEVLSAIVVLAAVAAWTASAWAQFPGGGDAVDIVGDSVTVSTADQSADSSLSDIDTQTAAIDTSVTTGGGGGNYTPNAQTIATLDQTLFPGNGVNAQNFATTFPGWKSCAPDCTDAGMAIDQATMAVYQGALSVAQQQEQQLGAEGDTAGTIDANVAQTTNVLYALQGIADLLAMQVQEQRYIRQQNDTIITLLATHYGQDLNDGMQGLATEVATTPGQQAQQ
jgi:hypothetical protein